MAVALAFLLFERQPLNRNSRYFKRIVFVLVLVVLPLDTEVVIRKFPLLVVFAFVDIRIVFVRIFFHLFSKF
jgi:hypothetical protein